MSNRHSFFDDDPIYTLTKGESVVRFQRYTRSLRYGDPGEILNVVYGIRVEACYSGDRQPEQFDLSLDAGRRDYRNLLRAGFSPAA